MKCFKVVRYYFGKRRKTSAKYKTKTAHKKTITWNHTIQKQNKKSWIKAIIVHIRRNRLHTSQSAIKRPFRSGADSVSDSFNCQVLQLHPNLIHTTIIGFFYSILSVCIEMANPFHLAP